MDAVREQDDYRLVWEETVKQIQNEVPNQDINLWFSRMQYHGSRQNTIIVSVPSNFHRDQIKARYLDLIENTLSEFANGSISLEFQIASNSDFYVSDESVKELQGSKSKNLKSTGDAGKSKVLSSKKQPTKKQHPALKEGYTFDNFIIGNNNSFAANASIAIAKNPGNSYNPCSLYGGVGLGKTHLLQSIGNSVHQEFSGLKIVYVTMENFMNEFIQSIRSEKKQAFKNKYRRADVLLVDDIQFLQKKPETQEELFHTFNALYDSNKQMVFTCDRPVAELRDINERLKSRFSRGLTLDLQPPDYETRIAILNKKIEIAGVSIPEDAVSLICENITSNVRDLEAALTRLIAYSELVNKSITLEITKQQLKDFFTSTVTQKNITIDVIQKLIAEYFGVSIQDLKSKRRTNTIVVPRQVAMYITREITEYSTTEVGLEFGGRDHTTVMHSCDRIKERMKSDPFFTEQVDQLKKTIIESSIQT